MKRTVILFVAWVAAIVIGLLVGLNTKAAEGFDGRLSVHERLRRANGDYTRNTEVERRIEAKENWRCVFKDDGSIFCRVEQPKKMPENHPQNEI